MSVSCFYDSYAIEDMTQYLKSLIKLKIAYDIHETLPDRVEAWDDVALIEYMLEEVTCLDKQKLFDFDGIPFEELLETNCFDIEPMLRISIPNTSWDKEEMLKKTIEMLFLISPDYSDGEYRCIEYQNDLIILACDVYLETFLFFVALKDLREVLLKREEKL